MTAYIGEIVLVNIGVMEEILRPAIVCKVREDGKADLHLFVCWKDIPLPAAVNAHSSSIGYLGENIREGEGTGEFRRMSLPLAVELSSHAAD